uniref:F-box associated beta-propeller type 3 domain-containing protein n=1 Tax=Aegilops tauschii TaxID=37682 RepID=M8AY38_AEGTA
MASEEIKSKKQRNDECIINCLPEDLIERIFLRLPQESVSGEPYPSDAILIDEAWSPSTCAVPVIGPDDFLFGSCNGLLGLYTKTSTIKVANLATGECLHLEKPAKNVKGDHFSFYSFAFHPVTKEYKITHFLGDCVEGRPHNKDRFSTIQVYTLGDEKWKDIRTPEALSLISVRNSGVVNVDGKMYWLTEEMLSSWQHAVMSFDLWEESFAMIQLPAACEDHDYFGPRKFWIRDIDGKICIVTAQTSRYGPKALAGELQIWTLDNTVEQQRWSQKYNIKNPPNYIPGPHFVHRDRILAQLCSDNVYAYELFGENCDVNLCKGVNLLDFSPRKPYNMQSYICVKSHEVAETMGKRCQFLKDKQHNIAEHVLTELKQVLQHKPDNPDQLRSIRRLNWVGYSQAQQKLEVRLSKTEDMMKVQMRQLLAPLPVTVPTRRNKGAFSIEPGFPGAVLTNCLCSFLRDSATSTRRLLLPWIGRAQPLFARRFGLLLHRLLVIALHFKFVVSTNVEGAMLLGPRDPTGTLLLTSNRNSGSCYE